MNIRQLNNTNTLLSIDDPSVYSGEDENTFANVINLGTGDLPEVGSINTLYLHTEEGLSVPYVYREDGKRTILPNPFSKGPTLPYPALSPQDGTQKQIYELNDNLVAIDNHLYALRKELSYWNLYKISYSVDSTDDFSPVLASLSPGEALIINFEGIFTYEGIKYKRGDVIVRLTNGEYVTIEGTTAGFYYPSKVSRVPNTKKYNLEYKFKQGQEPVDGPPVEIPSDSSLSEPAKTEWFEVEGGDQQESFIYAETIEVSSGSQVTATFTKDTYNSIDIPPIIKMFSSDGEEVWLDFICSASGSEYTIQINSKPYNVETLKYIYIK